MGDTAKDLAKRIQDLASEISGHMVNPSDAKNKIVGQRAAEIHDLAGKIKNLLPDDEGDDEQ